MKKSDPFRGGFTIIELLVVIVVIGVLAAITIVSYAGVNNRATVASLQSDLSTAAQQLKMYMTEYGSYPTALDGSFCPTSPIVDTKYCLKSSGSNSFTINPAGYAGTANSFTLTEVNGTNVWRVTDNTAPGAVAPLTAIAAFSGSPQVGSSFAAGTLSPAGASATASYQWQSAATSNGTYTNISGATSNSYTPVVADAGRYLEVVATGGGTYYGSITSAPSGAVVNPWINGIAATALAGKYVYNQDAGSFTWGPYNGTYCTSPQCSTTVYPAPDTTYPSDSVLVDPATNSNVDFTAYPAQAACKAIGGRLPTVTELVAVYTGRATYGNNFHSSGYYWTATEHTSHGPWYAWTLWFSNGVVSEDTKNDTPWVRCVKG